MSKDGNLDTSEFDPLANKEYTEEHKAKRIFISNYNPRTRS